MLMPNLIEASQELFRRKPDECYPTLQALWEHCNRQKEESAELWQPSQRLRPKPYPGTLVLGFDDPDGEVFLNDWSFSQLCRLAGVSKDTINRLSPETASRALQETVPLIEKPIQVLTANAGVRSVHGVAYTRLWDVDLLTMLREFATDFEPPQPGANGATGLYAGEQDMFTFLIDPTGWAEIDGQAYAPGFFVWNSEVGRRSLGVSTFWFQAVCQNHIVWDATEIVEFTRKHTARVHESLNEIRSIIEALVQKRDQRRDGFVKVIRKAMGTTLGDAADEVEKLLARNGITHAMAKKATEIAQKQGRFTLFSLVDALTRMTQEVRNAGDRTEVDQKVGKLLALAA